MYCKRCGATIHQGVLICPECGARQNRHVSSVRCANCYRRVPLGLTVCPHCGRDARPAGPRWALLLALVALVALAALWGFDKLPVARVGQAIANVRSNLSALVQVGDSTAAPTATPQALAQVTETPAAEQTPAETPSTEPAPVATETLAVAPTEMATSVASPTASPAPTEMPTATATLAPTPTPAPPTATARPPKPTATRPAGRSTTYRVQSGDTLSGIAAQFGITWQALAAANNLTEKSVLRIGQELVIPLAGAALPPAATPKRAATATAPATATPEPPAPTPAPYLAAPALTNPGDQAPFSGGDAYVGLDWQQVPGFAVSMQYQVTIRWAEQGAPQEHRWFTTTTSTRVPLWLWGRADQPTRQYTWFVTVVQVTTDGKGGERVIPLSPSSVSRVLYWN